MPPNSPSGCLGISSKLHAYRLLAAALFLAIVLAVAVGLFGIALVPLLIGCSFLLVCGFIVLLLQTRKGRMDDEIENELLIPLSGLPVRFSYEELRVATKDFTEKLASGGFGSVFKGMLEDGTIIAVKRLDKLSRDMKEFMAEVTSIGRIHHINLVNLIGYCAEKSFRLLVYEFMVNGSLENWIFNRDKNHCLSWETRKNIATGIARGLAYLHQGCHKTILHLDIKPENILLDENFNARISDFGLCELIDRDKSQILPTTRGTPGYIAPECQRMRTTEKADIYSFGIVLLEMISGRRNLERHSKSSTHLLRLLQRKSEENRLLDIMGTFDEEMQNHAQEVERMIKVAAWCLQNDYTRRPSMCTVVKLLDGLLELDADLSFNFTFALEDTVLDIDQASPPPLASVLSDPR